MKPSKKKRKNRYFHYQKEILNTISEPASFIDKSFRYIFVNKAFNEFYNVKTNDVVGKKAEFLWGKENLDNKIKPQLEKCIDGKDVYIQFDGDIPNNGFKILKMHFYPHWKTEKRIDGIISTSIDITEQKKAEQELIKSEKRLKKLNATKDKLFSIIGHDLKGPLHNILGFSELIDQGYENFSEQEIKEYNKLILQSSKTLSALLDNLLTWSRSQREKIKVTPKSFTVHPMVEKCFSLLQHNAEKKKIKMNNRVPVEAVAYADVDMTTTILRNLISNAIKFTSAGGTIAANAQLKDGILIVEVRDTGIGIPQDKIENLFEPDQTHVNLGTEGEKGTGLGLIICKDFAEKNKGELWAESKMGEGSVFYLSIPAINKK